MNIASTKSYRPLAARSWSRATLKSALLLVIVAILLMSPIFQAHASGIFQASSPPSDEFTFFTMTLEVKDSSDSPIAGAQVLAFSDDWGVRIPGTLDTSTFLTTDSAGHATFQVPKGMWTFFAYHGDSGICFFLTASLQVQSSTTVSLKPTSTFSVSAYSISGNPIDIDDFRIVDESHAPILPTTSCGTTAAGQISVSVNSQGPFRILAVRRPTASEGYYLLATNVSPSQNLEIRPSTSSSASVTFRAFGSDNSPTSGNVEVRLPDFDINNMVIDFNFAGTATVIFTPMRVVYNFRFLPSGWYLYFSSEAYQLAAGSSREIRFGGPLMKQLQVIPHASTGQGGSPTFAPMTQIWLKIADQYGHILISMSTPSGKPNFPFALTQSGNTVFQGSIPQGDPFTLKIPSEYSDSASPDYSVSGDLGPFGTFSLNGKLISSETSYQLSTFNSAHFRMAVPVGLGEQTSRITSFMDQLYETAQAMTGQPINGDIQYEVDLMGGGFSWENLPVPTKLLLIMYLTTEPLSPGTLFTTSHEFGHTRTLREPTDIVLDFWMESYPSLIAIEGISRIYGQKMWLWLTGQHDFFFYHLQGRPVSDRGQQIEVSQFVLAYLEKKFGWDIHHRLFSQWSTDLASKAQTLSANGFQASEVYATLYSFLAGQNLAWIFGAAGLEVTDARVTQGLNLISSAKAPSLNLSAPQINGLAVTVNGTASPGTPGTTITRINWIWGDRTSGDASFPATHTYTQAGTYTINATAFQSDGLSTTKATSVTLQKAFDFSLSNSGGITVVPGGSGSTTVTVTLLSGSSQLVSLSCPSQSEFHFMTGLSCSFNPASGYPTFSSILTITVSPGAASGSYSLPVKGNGGGLQRTTTVALTVSSQGYLTVDTDKPQYAPGEVVHISGEVVTPSITWTYTLLSGLEVQIQILDPANNLICQGASSPEGAGYKRYAYDYPLASNATSGSYTIHAKWTAFFGSTLEGEGHFSVVQVTGQLSVGLASPPSPANGATMSSSPVTLEVKVASQGSPVQSATVTIYVDSGHACSGVSDLSGIYSCGYSPSQGGHSWYATASKSGYASGTSQTWTFTYQPPPPGRCIIATAAYGSEMAPDVVYMRYVRDQVIGSTHIGRALVNAFNTFYYAWSPTVAQAITGNELLRALFRVLLLPIVWIAHVAALTFTSVADAAGSSDAASVVAFLVAASLSVAIYVALPVLVITKLAQAIRKRSA